MIFLEAVELIMAHRKSREHLVGIARKNATTSIAHFKKETVEEFSTGKKTDAEWQVEWKKSNRLFELETNTTAKRKGIRQGYQDDEGNDMDYEDKRERISFAEERDEWRSKTPKEKQELKQFAAQLGISIKDVLRGDYDL